MFVIVAGGGRVGSTLAERLLEGGHKVRLIEHRPAVLERLHRELPTEVIVVGQPTDPDLLERIGVRQAQALAIVLSDDAQTLSLASLARFRYQVPRIIARVNDPRNRWLFEQDMGVDVALNQVEIFTSLVAEEISLGDMMTLLKLRRGKYMLVEEKIPPGAPVIGQPIKDLDLPQQCVIAAIIRHGEIVVPRGMTALEVEDEVLAITDAQGAEALHRLFTPKSQA
ncbi:MAG TPA: TrkA family potassium uptake protein [Anaerolineae bacterium]|nr:TrkA family potassium uptake protein [Anaerolineae bacterium]HID85202.1 TrkA family potassium uptake protein [Anaerolineales bacterium]HIQ08347.1 TrkA family potassium uptake protein [Anaerolineaceae bacterium]